MRILKMFLGLTLVPYLLIHALLTFSLSSFRYFFTSGDREIYDIDEEISRAYDLRTNHGRKEAQDAQRFKDKKTKIQKQKSLTSENKYLVIAGIVLSGALFALGFYNEIAILTLVPLALTYFLYSYFKIEITAKIVNRIIGSINKSRETQA